MYYYFTFPASSSEAVIWQASDSIAYPPQSVTPPPSLTTHTPLLAPHTRATYCLHLSSRRRLSSDGTYRA